jgi:hypothetical protein
MKITRSIQKLIYQKIHCPAIEKMQEDPIQVAGLSYRHHHHFNLNMGKGIL